MNKKGYYVVILLLALCNSLFVGKANASEVKQINLNNVLKSEEWAEELMNIDEARLLGITGEGIKVAVMDTGILDHEDYTVVSGIDCVNRTIFNKCRARNVDKYPEDINGHGTDIAHIIANKEFGIAKSVSLYDIRVVDYIDGMPDIKYSSIIKGIEWAIENDIDIINMSLGGNISPTDKLLLAFQKAYENDIRIFASAGNLHIKEKIKTTLKSNTLIDFPCKLIYTFCVGGVMKYENKIERTIIEQVDAMGVSKIAYASAAGEEIDFIGPDIKVKTKNKKDEIIHVTGTSYSTPYVAAVYALYLDYYDDMSKTQIDDMFKKNASKNNLEVGYDWEYGLGYPKFLKK